MVWTFLQNFSFIPRKASEEKIFYFYFLKFILSVALATKQIQQFGQNIYVWYRTTQGTFLKSFCQNICSEVETRGPLVLYCSPVYWGYLKISFVCLCWGLTSQSTIFQSCRDGATTSWVINQYFQGVKCLAQRHNTAAVGFEPLTSRSGVRHSTTEPPRSTLKISSYWGKSFKILNPSDLERGQ